MDTETVTETEEHYDAKWLGKNRHQVEMIIRSHYSGYRWSDPDVLQDLVSSVVAKFVERRVPERWVPALGTWRTYFYTATVRQAEAFLRPTHKRVAQRTSVSLNDEIRLPAEPWEDTSDTNLDMHRWLQAYTEDQKFYGRANRVPMLLMLSEGMTPKEVAVKCNVTKQVVSSVLQGARKHWDRWHTPVGGKNVK